MPYPNQIMNIVSKILNWVKSSQYNIFLGVCILFISFISYNLGKISLSDKAELKITEGANIYKAVVTDEVNSEVATTPKVTPKTLDMRVVVSKASTTKKYHYTWCPGAKQIKDENKVWFNSDKEAETNGYTLAGNCTK